MSIAAISSAAISQVKFAPFHPKNRTGAKRALVLLRQVFVQRIYQEIKQNSWCRLVVDDNAGKPGLRVSSSSGIRPDFIADPLDIAGAMKLQGMLSVTFSNFPEISEDSIDDALRAIISYKKLKPESMLIKYVPAGSMPAPIVKPHYIGPEEFAEALAHPQIKFNSDIKPMLFDDVLSYHKNMLPFSYSAPLIDKAIEYLQKGKTKRFQRILDIIFSRTTYEERPLLFECLEKKLLELAKNEQSDVAADSSPVQILWWTLLGIRGSLGHKVWLMRCMLKIAESYFKRENVNDQDREKAKHCWSIVKDITCDTPDVFNGVFPDLKQFANKILLLDRDIGLEALKVLGQKADKDRFDLIEELKRLLYANISWRLKDENKNLDLARFLCKALYEAMPDKEGAVRLLMSIVTRRLDPKADTKDHQVDEALFFFEVVYSLDPCPEHGTRLINSILSTATALTLASTPEKKDLPATIKIWAYVFGLDLPAPKKYNMLGRVLGLITGDNSPNQEILETLEKQNGLWANNPEISIQMRRIKVLLYFNLGKNDAVLRIADIMGNNDYYVMSYRPAAFLRKKQSIKSFRAADALVKQLERTTDPDIFCIDAWIRALFTRGFAFIQMKRDNLEQLSSAEEDFNSAIALAKKYKMMEPYRAKVGLEYLARLRGNGIISAK